MPSLPFLKSARLVELGGAAVTLGGAPVVVECSIWPSNGRRLGPSGRHYTHEGEAEAHWYESLRVPNRALEVDGVTYRITDAILHEFVPHVELNLTETS